MNQEPMQFLPVAPFWRQRKPSRKVERAFCWGVVIGSALTLIVAVILSHI